MITQREIFLTVTGVILTTEYPSKVKNALIRESAKEFGINESEIPTLLKEVSDTLAYTIQNLLKKMNGKESEPFGV